MAVDVDDLRNLLRDEDENVFTDENLEAAIVAGGDNINRCAGNAIRALAVEYALRGVSIRTDDLGLNSLGRGETLSDIADSFFKDAADSDAGEAAGGYAIIPFGGRASRSCCVVPEASPHPCCGRC